MREPWELLTAGEPDADRSVLLLPGGADAARSYGLVMEQPALSGVRLVATTLPGMAGAPLSGDVSVPGLARTAGQLAEAYDCDVVAGFSHGATVALEMVLAGHFRGPAVLLGISLTTEDEARFFRAVVRASQRGQQRVPRPHRFGPGRRGTTGRLGHTGVAGPCREGGGTRLRRC